MKNLREMLHPLYEFLADGVKIAWMHKCQKAFERAKNVFRVEKSLALFIQRDRYYSRRMQAQ